MIADLEYTIDTITGALQRRLEIEAMFWSRKYDALLERDKLRQSIEESIDFPVSGVRPGFEDSVELEKPNKIRMAEAQTAADEYVEKNDLDFPF